ncbi:MAG: hypothetical protein SFV24_25730 [Gemmatimonadales bacterium]|nr:hypothetical protein [Gemmatimonadales bacterium]
MRTFSTALLVALTLGGCDTDSLGPDARINATVRFVPIEGGCWVLEARGGKRYEPIGLPEALRRDGTPVSVAIRLRPDLVSICAVGELVDVVAIRER